MRMTGKLLIIIKKKKNGYQHKISTYSKSIKNICLIQFKYRKSLNYNKYVSLKSSIFFLNQTT